MVVCVYSLTYLSGQDGRIAGVHEFKGSLVKNETLTLKTMGLLDDTVLCSLLLQASEGERIGKVRSVPERASTLETQKETEILERAMEMTGGTEKQAWHHPSHGAL